MGEGKTDTGIGALGGLGPRCFGYLGAACLTVVAVLTLVVPGSATAANTTFVDCLAAGVGSGSEAQPLNSLSAANSQPLEPGDVLVFKRGTVCNGELAPLGGGSAGVPVTIGAYGSGPLPKIVGNGRDAVSLNDLSNLVIEDLDISNPGESTQAGVGAEIRNGVVIRASGGTVRNLTARRLVVHDVAGDLTKNPQGSAGILATVGGPPPVRFENLTIEDNSISEVSRSAISIYGTNDPDRPAASDPWPEASTGVVIRRNRIDQFAGDGIVPRGTDGAVVEDNLVSRGSLAGRKLGDPAGEICNAGIWAFRANNTLIRGNEVSGMKAGCDGTGFDLDYNQDGTIIERNYSHDNEGGFVLLCADTGRRGDVRFNLSVNDASTINHGPCAGHFGDLGGIRFFNNTIVAPNPNASMQLVIQSKLQLAGDFQFKNNLIYATARQARPMPCGDFCSNNLFFNLPASGAKALTANPLLIDPLRTGAGRLSVGSAFRLAAKSPARGAGVILPEAGSGDYFGNPFSLTQAPGIGIDQDAAPKPPGPTAACRKARSAKNRMVSKTRSAHRRLVRLKQRGVPKKATRAASRKLRVLRKRTARLTTQVRQRCR